MIHTFYRSKNNGIDVKVKILGQSGIPGMYLVRTLESAAPRHWRVVRAGEVLIVARECLVEMEEVEATPAV